MTRIDTADLRDRQTAPKLIRLAGDAAAEAIVRAETPEEVARALYACCDALAAICQAWRILSDDTEDRELARIASRAAGHHENAWGPLRCTAADAWRYSKTHADGGPADEGGESDGLRFRASGTCRGRVRGPGAGRPLRGPGGRREASQRGD